MVALVALGVVACDKNDGVENMDKAPKSVSINLTNLQTARSVGQTVGNGSTADLNNFYVLFTDGTKVYKGKDKDGAAINHYVDSDLTGEKLFHFLDAAVNKVVIIGNIDETFRNSLDALESGKADLSEVTATLDIENQQDDNLRNLVLFGTSGLTEAIVDEQDPNHGNFYTASVEIAPLVARVEIHNFSCDFTEGTPLYNTLDLIKVALNNYNKTCTIKGDNFTYGGLENTEINNQTAMGFLETVAAGWHNDLLLENTQPIQLTPANPEFELVDDQTPHVVNRPYVYHVFPQSGILADNMEQMVLKVDGDGTKPLYLATKGFGQLFVAGNVYVVSFAFKDSDFYQPEKCIEVSVTVKPWTVIPVTPSFN